MKQKRGVILMKGGRPDDVEIAFMGHLMAQRVKARFVRFKFYDDPDVELERVHAAYSQYPELLEPYKRAGAETEVIPSEEGAEGAVPEGLPPLPDGFTYQEAGPRFKLIDADGKQVGKAFYKKEAEAFLADNLP